MQKNPQKHKYKYMLSNTAPCRRRLESSKLYTLDWKRNRSRQPIKIELLQKDGE